MPPGFNKTSFSRLGAGVAISSCLTVEAGYFALEHAAANFFVASDPVVCGSR